jgi:hypothetical protein
VRTRRKRYGAVRECLATLFAPEGTNMTDLIHSATAIRLRAREERDERKLPFLAEMYAEIDRRIREHDRD